MTPDELSDELDGIAGRAQPRLLKQIAKTNKALFNQMELLLVKLELSNDGTIKQSQFNRKILSKVDQYFNRAFTNTGYYQNLNILTKVVLEMTDKNALYFDFILDNFTKDARYLKSLQKETIKTVQSYLANEGLEAAMKRPIIEIMNQNLNTGASYNDLLRQTREFILGSDKLDPTLVRYSKQITTDTLFNYNRALQEAVSQNAGLQFYYYSGGIIDDTRDFCMSRVGKYYHKAEIEQWAKLTWQGKRKGTTASTIFIFAGGYNCLHKAIAVSELMVPAEVIERAKTKGYYREKVNAMPA